jgi:hypothetical protein
VSHELCAANDYGRATLGSNQFIARRKTLTLPAPQKRTGRELPGMIADGAAVDRCGK